MQTQPAKTLTNQFYMQMQQFGFNATFANLSQVTSHAKSSKDAPQKCLSALIELNRLKNSIIHLRTMVKKQLHETKLWVGKALGTRLMTMPERNSRGCSLIEGQTQNLSNQKDTLIVLLQSKIQELQWQKQDMSGLLRRQTQLMKATKKEHQTQVFMLNTKVNELYSILDQKIKDSILANRQNLSSIHRSSPGKSDVGCSIIEEINHHTRLINQKQRSVQLVDRIGTSGMKRTKSLIDRQHPVKFPIRLGVLQNIGHLVNSITALDNVEVQVTDRSLKPPMCQPLHKRDPPRKKSSALDKLFTGALKECRKSHRLFK